MDIYIGFVNGLGIRPGFKSLRGRTLRTVYFVAHWVATIHHTFSKILRVLLAKNLEKWAPKSEAEFQFSSLT